MSAADLQFIERGSEEWERVWKLVDDDPAMLDKETGECWQYMGTERHGNEWLHAFRHRHHPVLGKRIYKRIPASQIVSWNINTPQENKR